MFRWTLLLEGQAAGIKERAASCINIHNLTKHITVRSMPPNWNTPLCRRCGSRRTKRESGLCSKCCPLSAVSQQSALHICRGCHGWNEGLYGLCDDCTVPTLTGDGGATLSSFQHLFQQARMGFAELPYCRHCTNRTGRPDGLCDFHGGPAPPSQSQGANYQPASAFGSYQIMQD